MRANDLPEMDELFPVRFNVLSYSEIKKRPLRSVTGACPGAIERTGAGPACPAHADIGTCRLPVARRLGAAMGQGADYQREGESGAMEK